MRQAGSAHEKKKRLRGRGGGQFWATHNPSICCCRFDLRNKKRKKKRVDGQFTFSVGLEGLTVQWGTGQTERKASQFSLCVDF